MSYGTYLSPQSIDEKIRFNVAYKREKYEQAQKQGKKSWDDYPPEEQQRYQEYND